MSVSKLVATVFLAFVGGSVVVCDYTHQRSFLRPSYRPALFNHVAGGRDQQRRKAILAAQRFHRRAALLRAADRPDQYAPDIGR